jgi:hypothetical protein
MLGRMFFEGEDRIWCLHHSKVGTNHLHYVECLSGCLRVDRIKVVLGLAGSNCFRIEHYGFYIVREIIMVGVVL